MGQEEADRSYIPVAENYIPFLGPNYILAQKLCDP